jgi:competence protein ComEA
MSEQVNPFGDVGSKIDQYKYPLILCFLGVVLILGGLFSSNIFQKSENYPAKSVMGSSNAQITTLKVDVSGAINKPGVYTFKMGDRIEDAIREAGGFREDVNKIYITKTLNLSQKLSDGMKLYLPYDGDIYTSLSNDINSNSKIGINSGSSSQLESLPGVGPVTAQKIIQNRPYNKIEDLVNKKVVGTAVYTKIKDLIEVY